MYKCGICGKEYNDIDDYIKCVSKCGNDVKLEEFKRKEELIKAEKESRKKELDAAYHKYIELRDKYYKDYGEYEISFNSNALDSIPAIIRKYF